VKDTPLNKMLVVNMLLLKEDKILIGKSHLKTSWHFQFPSNQVNKIDTGYEISNLCVKVVIYSVYMKPCTTVPKQTASRWL